MRFNATAIEKSFVKIQKESRRQGVLMMRQAGRQFVMRSRRESKDSVMSREAITEVRNRLGWGMIFRGTSQTPNQELRRRLKARYTFSKAWRFWMIDANKERVRIWIQNTVKYSGIIEERDHVTITAGNIVGATFQRKLAAITRKINQAWKANTSGQYL
jgi:hypothetical protein